MPNHTTQAYRRYTTKFRTSETSALDGEWSGSGSGRCTLKSRWYATAKLVDSPQSWFDVVVRIETGTHSPHSANTHCSASQPFFQAGIPKIILHFWRTHAYENVYRKEKRQLVSRGHYPSVANCQTKIPVTFIWNFFFAVFQIWYYFFYPFIQSSMITVTRNYVLRNVVWENPLWWLKLHHFTVQ